MPNNEHTYKIYRVGGDQLSTWVLAKSYRHALELWAAYMATDGPQSAADYLKDHEPEEMQLICDEADLILPEKWNTHDA